MVFLLNQIQVVYGNCVWTAYSHLEGAKAAVEAHSRYILRHHNARMRFLLTILRYFDVMIALSVRQPRLNCNLDKVESLGNANQTSSPGADVIFGFAKTLCPMLEDLADILASRDKCEDVVIIEAKNLKQKLQDWKPRRGKVMT